MNKNYKKLIKKPALIKIGEDVSKIALFFMLPIYTLHILPEEFGKVGLCMLCAVLSAVILTFNVNGAVAHFSKTEEKYSHGAVFSSAFFIIALVDLAAAGILFLLKFSGALKIETPLYIFIYICFVAFSGCQFFQSYLIARGEKEVVSISNITANSVIILMSVIGICVKHSGVYGYLSAFSIGNALRLVILLVLKDCKIKEAGETPEKSLIKKLLFYGAPLMISAGYMLVNSLSAQIAVFFFCPMSLLGIFTVANKISVILFCLQGMLNKRFSAAFSNGFDEYDASGIFGAAFSKISTLSAVFATLLILFNRTLAKILFSGKFYSAWHYSPIITAAAMFLGLVIFQNKIFTACGKKRLSDYTLLGGTALSVLLALVLVPAYGLFGASYALLSGYTATFAVRGFLLYKHVKMQVNWVQQGASLLLVLLHAIVSTTSGYGLVPYFFPIAVLLINIPAIMELINIKNLLPQKFDIK